MRKYDTPILAMVKALNRHVGKEVDLVTLREDWWYEIGDKEGNYLGHWLDKTIELFSDHVKIIYKRTPGWYTEVVIFVEKEIEV